MYTLSKSINAPVFRILTLIIFLFAGLKNGVQAQGCSQPSNLNSQVLAGGTVALSWSAISGATGYTVQYRLNNSGTWINGGTVATTSQVLTGLLPETVYGWRVRASCSTFSSVAFFNTGGAPGGNTACSSPSNLEANVTGPGTAQLSWSAIEGALYYTVQYRQGQTGAWTNAGSVPGTSITLNGLLLNVEYSWRVKASCSVYSSQAVFNTGASGNGGNSACSQPSNLEAFLLSNTSVELSWSEIQEALNYTVQYRKGLSGAWITAGTVSGLNLVLNGLLENTEYSWRVKASCSVYSSQAVFTTGGSGGGSGSNPPPSSCSAPSNTNTDVVLPSSAQVSWEPVAGVSVYTVQYRLELGGSAYTTVGNFSTPNATISGLTPGLQYVWRVKASCSPYGSDVQFQTPAAMSVSTKTTPATTAPSLKLFPNPSAQDEVTITTEQPGAQIQVLDLSGQLLISQTMNDSSYRLPIAQLSNGVYLVRLQTPQGESISRKLVLVR